MRILPSILLTAAILLIPAALYAYGRQADAFAVRTVKVEGAKRVPKKKAVHLLRKKVEGRNLFTVTSADVREALEPLCYVAAVEVDRDFPTTLHVRVIEHRPLLYVLAGGRWYLVADTGHVICKVGTEKGIVAATAGSGEPAAAAGSGQSGAATVKATSAATGDAAPAPAGAPSASDSPAPSASAAGDGASDPAASDAAAGGAGVGDAAGDAAAAPVGGNGAGAVAAALRRGPAKMKSVLPRMAAAKAPRVGQTARDDDVRLGLRVLAALPASLRSRVGVLTVGDEAQVTLHLRGGPVVELGGEARVRAKVLSLEAVLGAYRRAHVTPSMVDVSAPARPLARPRLSSR